GNALAQLVTFRAGVDFRRWPEDGAVLTIARVIHRFFPHEFARMMGSRQQQGRLDVDELNILYTAVVVLSLAALLRPRPQAPVGHLPLAVAVALPVNAAATGALSVVADRYQARVIWLVPFCFAVVLLSQRRRLSQRALHRSFTEGSV